MSCHRPPRRRVLPLAMLLAAVGLAGSTPLHGAPPPGKVVLRNDGFTLSPELVVGRFGSGRLFFDRPMDVAVDEDDNVFVLDLGNNRIQVLDENSRFRRQWALKVPSDSGRDRPAAMAFDRRGKTILFLDGDAATVQKYETDGRLSMTLGRSGLSSGRMDRPVDLDVDAFGYVYVLDQGRNKVLRYHRSGAFVGEWGERGTRDNQFLEPVAIATSEEGLGIVYVLDRGRSSLLAFSREGVFQSAIGLEGLLSAEGPSALRFTVGKDGDVFIIDGITWKLIKLDKRALSVFALEPGSAAGGIAVDDGGRVYVSDSKAHKLLRFTLEMK